MRSRRPTTPARRGRRTRGRARTGARHRAGAIEPELVTDPPAAPAAPFAQPGWTASSMAAAPADRERLDAGLARSRGGFMTRLREAIGEDGDTSWDDIEETLIAGDVGAALAMDVVEKARAARHADGTEAAVREQLGALLVERDLDWEPRPAGEGQPAVVLVVGVNGTGKTTTIGKLATRYAGEGRSVILAAGDTFRAAAIDQLRIWADRAGCRSLRTLREPTPAPLSTTRWTRRSPGKPTWSSPTPRVASTPSRT